MCHQCICKNKVGQKHRISISSKPNSWWKTGTETAKKAQKHSAHLLSLSIWEVSRGWKHRHRLTEWQCSESEPRSTFRTRPVPAVWLWQSSNKHPDVAHCYLNQPSHFQCIKLGLCVGPWDTGDAQHAGVTPDLVVHTHTCVCVLDSIRCSTSALSLGGKENWAGKITQRAVQCGVVCIRPSFWCMSAP